MKRALRNRGALFLLVSRPIIALHKKELYLLEDLVLGLR